MYLCVCMHEKKHAPSHNNRKRQMKTGKAPSENDIYKALNTPKKKPEATTVLKFEGTTTPSALKSFASPVAWESCEVRWSAKTV